MDSSTPEFATLHTQHDPHRHLRWVFLNPKHAPTGFRPCISEDLLTELNAVMDRTQREAAAEADRDRNHLTHLVLTSEGPVFNLGGDLGLMIERVRRGERHELLRYVTHGCESAYRLHGHVHPHVHTVALIQGTALGGGLEMALSCDTIVAEAGVKMGLPESLFGSFAGVGAYSFLYRRIGPAAALKMMREGKTYTSEEMHALGVVDRVVPKGEGKAAVEELVDRHRLCSGTITALAKVRETVVPVTVEELVRIAEIWVDTVMGFGSEQLGHMEKLVQAQLKKMADVRAAA